MSFSQFHEEVRTLTLSATAEEPRDALNQILSKMREQMLREIKGTILFMAPKHVTVTKMQPQERKETFLGMLWPRIRREIQVEAALEIEVRWLEFTS